MQWTLVFIFLLENSSRLINIIFLWTQQNNLSKYMCTGLIQYARAV